MNNSPQASGLVKKGQVQAEIAKFNGMIHHRDKENALNNTTTPNKRQSLLRKPTSRAHEKLSHQTPSGKRMSRLPLPTSASQQSAGENMLTTPSRRMLTPSTHDTPAMASLMEELNSNLDQGREELLKTFQSNTDMLANVANKGFHEVNRSLALHHSLQKTHNRTVNGKLDNLLSEFESRTAEMQDAMTKQISMMQQLSASKTNIPSSITASTDPSSSAMTSVRNVLFSSDDVTSSTGNSTLSKPTPSKPLYLPVVPTTKTTEAQSIDNILLGEELEKSQAANAALEQEIRSLGVKFEQQEKRMKSMTAPPGHRDVMDIKPTPTEHSERTNKSINKAVKTIRRGNKNRDIAPTPTRRSARNRPSVKKDP